MMKIDGTAETSLYVDGRISDNARASGEITSCDYVSGVLGNYAEKELLFGSFKDFPSVGNKKHLYIDESENKIYRFDEENAVYKCVSGDFVDIEIIQSYI